MTGWGGVIADRQLEELLDRAGVTVWEFDLAKGSYTFVSPAAEGLLGFPVSSWLEPGFWIEHIHSHDVEWVMSYSGIEMEAMRDHTIEYRMLHADGSYRWVRHSITHGSDNTGNGLLHGTMTAIGDGGSRMRAEAFPTSSGEAPGPQYLTERLLDVLGGLAVLTVNGDSMRITHASKKAEELFGYGPGQMIGMDVMRVHESPAAFAGYDSKMGRQVRRGERHWDQVALRRADGSLFDAEMSVQPIWKGSAERLDIIRDLSYRKLAEKRLSESERRFRRVVEASPMGMYFFERRGDELIFTGANPAADQVFGIPHEERVGLVFEQAFPGVAERGLREQYLRVAREGGTWYAAAFEFYFDSTLRVFDIVAFQNAPDQVAAIFNEVTLRRKAEARERKYLARLSAMAAELTAAEDRERRRVAEQLHDRVSQPLAVARMRLRNACRPEVGADFDELAVTQALLEDAIHQARAITTSLCPPMLYELGIGAALRWLVEDMRDHYELSVELETRVDESALSLDSKLTLFRVAQELAMNVVKHSGVHEASMSVVSDVARCTLIVEDHGRGFDENDLISDDAEPGFGLFSIRERAPHLGAIFELGSTPGQGTKVSFSVPLDAGW